VTKPFSIEELTARIVQGTSVRAGEAAAGRLKFATSN